MRVLSLNTDYGKANTWRAIRKQAVMKQEGIKFHQVICASLHQCILSRHQGEFMKARLDACADPLKMRFIYSER